METKISKIILTFLQTITALIFILSGGSKLFDSAAFVQLSISYGLGYFSVLAPFVALFEVVVGLLLLLNIKIRKTAFVAFVTFIFFTVLFSYAFFVKGITDCGCSGSVSFLKTTPLFTYLRNIILAAAMFWLWKKSENEGVIKNEKLVIIYVATIIGSFLGGISFSLNESNIEIPESENSENSYLNETEIFKYINFSKDSTYLVYVFSFNCEHCWNSAANALQYANSNIVDSVICIASGSKEAEILFRKYYKALHVITIEWNDLLKINNQFPISFFVKHNSFQNHIQGQLPTPYLNELKILNNK